MKTTLLTFLGLITTPFLFGQNVNIPDANFKAYLVGESSINTNGDTEIQVSEAQAYSGTINCGNMGITDMTGIEEFVNIDYLYCHQNQLTSLDLSNNTALVYFNCRNNGAQFTSITFGTNSTLTYIVAYDNGFTSLDVSGLSALESLDCKQNQLTSLNVNNCSNLGYLNCRGNQLTSLDVSTNSSLANLTCNNNDLTALTLNNSSLINLECSSNQLTSLDLSSLNSLEVLTCNANSLTSLDFSNNTALTSISFSQNQLNSVDVSSLTNLTGLNCLSNSITSLDVSTNTALNYLTCQNNSLTELNVANGNNTNFTLFRATNNPSLSCIEVDDVTYSMNNWSNDVDASTNFSEACNCIVTIPDANFKAALLDHGVGITGPNISVIDTSGDGEIQCSEAATYTGTINLNTQSIADLTGIEAFTGLTELDCQNNTLSSIDVSTNVDLTFLNTGNNNLGSLDVSNNTSLTTLYCYGNQINSLDVSGATALIELDCRMNWLGSLDISNNTALTELRCDENFLTSLNVSSNTALTYIGCWDNQLSSLDISSNTNLITLACQTNNLSSLDLTNNSVLTQLVCQNNQLTSLDVSNGNNASITDLNATNNSGLTCIQHDTGFDPTTNPNWQKDAAASWSDNCSLSLEDETTIELSIYPNPASDIINIESNQKIEAVRLLNINGKLIKQTNNKSIAVGELKPGVYLVQVTTLNGVVTKRIVKR